MADELQVGDFVHTDWTGFGEKYVAAVSVNHLGEKFYTLVDRKPDASG